MYIGTGRYDRLKLLEDKSDTLLLVVIAVYLIAGIGYSIILNDALRFPDEQDYLNIANNLLKTGHYSIDGVVPTAKRPPGYPIILYLLMQCGAGIVTFRIVNYLLLAFSLILLYKLLAKTESKLTGLVAVLLCALYPIYFYTAGTILSQTAGVALFVSVLYLIAREKSSSWSFLGGGILYGYLILTVPLFLINLPIVSLAPWLLKSEKWLKKIAVFIIAVLLVMGVWTLRNYFALNHFVPLTTNSGINFLLGNHELSRPTSYIAVYNYVQDHFAEEIKDLDEYERDILFRHKAWEWVKNNKTAALKLYLLKVINYFNYNDTLATHNKFTILKKWLLLISYLPLLIIFIIRLILIHYYKLSRFELYLMIIYLSNAFLIAIFHIRIRWRMPYDMLLIAMVAIFLVRLLRDKPALENR